MEGKVQVSDIQISGIIDHQPYREMIKNLVALRQSRNCLVVIAIDAGNDIEMNRDEWMAIQLANCISSTPILALLGNFHALKRVDWENDFSKPHVAEILSQQGVLVSSFGQVWDNQNCIDNEKFVFRIEQSNSAKATENINQKMISLLNASLFESVSDVVDGVVFWECSETGK